MNIHRISVAVAMLAAALFPAAAPAAERSFGLDLAGGKVPAAQRALRVEKGDAVRVRVTSDAPGELHLHGYELAATVAPGAAAELSFTARATGRYRFEWHRAGEAAKGGAHHGPPLAVLEVRPR